jgi:hypothetical protein
MTSTKKISMGPMLGIDSDLPLGARQRNADAYRRQTPRSWTRGNRAHGCHAAGLARLNDGLNRDRRTTKRCLRWLCNANSRGPPPREHRLGAQRLARWPTHRCAQPRRRLLFELPEPSRSRRPRLLVKPDAELFAPHRRVGFRDELVYAREADPEHAAGLVVRVTQLRATLRLPATLGTANSRSSACLRSARS